MSIMALIPTVNTDTLIEYMIIAHDHSMSI